MLDKELSFEQVKDDIKINAHVVFSGDDLTVSIFGGDKPHIGSVSIALPHPNLNEPANSSATVSSFNLTGHRDNPIGDLFAKTLATKLGITCVVTCGIHFNHFNTSKLNSLQSLCETLLEKMLHYFSCMEKIKNLRPF